MHLQDRYLFKKLSKAFIVVLSALIVLFLLIDYALQSKGFAGFYYYGAKISSFAAILLPFAFLLSFLFVLSELNSKRQWLALQACRVSSWQLLKPFFLAAFILTILLFINNHFFSHLYDYKTLKKTKLSYLSPSSEKVHALKLRAGGYLFFQKFDPKTEILHDIFWLPEGGSIWHISTLSIAKDPVIATQAKEMVQQSDGTYILKENYPEIPLPDFRFELPEDTEELLDTKQQSLGLLARKARLFPSTDQEAKTASYFYIRLLMPLLPLLLLFAAAPSSLRFSKTFSHFFLFAFWSAFYIITIALLDAAFFLGESLLLNPLLAISLPLLVVLALGVFSWNRST